MNRTAVLLALVPVFALGCSVLDKSQALNRNKAHWIGGPDTRGRENFKAFVADGRRRAPDLKQTVDQIVAEGDLVVTRFTSRGTFASDPGEPSKTKEVTMQEIAIHRIRDGKIVEQWTIGGLVSIRDPARQ